MKGDGQNTNEWDERLRQVGLAQGMVKLASNFSDGKAVDYVETDKSRIVLHELEKNWWILASVDLTRLPTSAARSEATSQNETQSALFQYSSREMCPPQLLLQHLIRTHSIFLLLHDFTLDGLYQRVGRSVFCGLLERFWEKFAWTWDILLSGNPAVDIFNGIKLSAGGELGIGVGEEQWGSGERAVLEDLVTRTDGLVDLVVSRFGDAPAPIEEPSLSKESNNSSNAMDGKLKWLGLDVYPQPSDGVIFAGTGAVSRPSLVQISQWMEWIYRYGDNAYGVGGDPSSTRRRRHRKIRAKQPSRDTSAVPAKTERTADSSPRQAPDRPFSPGIPRPLVTGTPEPSQDSHQKDNSNADDDNSSTGSGRWSVLPGFGTEKAKRYLTLGYGSSWSLWPQTLPSHPRVSALKNDVDGPQEEAKQKNPPTTTGTDLERDQPAEGDQAKARSDTFGSFIIGLRDEPGSFRARSYEDNTFIGKPKDGIVLRTLHIWLAASGDTTDQQKKVQVVVYAHQPFMFTFIFDPQTPFLHEPSFYHSIQHQLRPLHKPLLASTSLENIVSRISISDGVFDFKSRFSTKIHPVYDLVYDPSNLTIRSSIPNIPDLGSHQTESSDPNTPPWSRVESVNIHHRLLNTYIETRSHPDELERTYKTNRGWWVVWVRVSGDDNHQEAFVVRKASDYVSPSSQHNRTGSNSARFFRDLGGASSSSSFSGFQFSRADMAPGKLAEGLGLDARRYIESLLSLNR